MEVTDGSDESDTELWQDSSSSGSDDSAEPVVADVPLSDKETSSLKNFARFMHTDDISSDEEVVKNTIGDVPLKWYDHLPHIGYDHSAKKIQRRAGLSAVDAAIANEDDPDYKWTVYDEYNGEERTLTRRQLVLLQRLQAGKVAHPETNQTPDYIPYYSSQVEIAIHSRPASKKSFVPSKSEELIVARLRKGIREGRIQLHKKKKDQDEELFLMWGDDNWSGHKRRRGGIQLKMPKMPTPGHSESYNPPEEYLLSPEETAKLEAMHPSDRPANSFIPKKFDSLRKVPAYANFVKERFERCLDLYLCPATVRKKKAQIDPKSLIPNLPHPRELRPFPEEEVLRFEGHTGRVRSISVSPSGQWLLSCSDDGSVRCWECDTGRCSSEWQFEETPVQVVWSPNPLVHLALVAVGSRVVVLDAGTAAGYAADVTAAQLDGAHHNDADDAEDAEDGNDGGDGDDDGDEDDGDDADKDADTSSGARGVRWREPSDNGKGGMLSAAAAARRRVIVQLKHKVRSVAWHHRGDYFATVCPDAPPVERVAVHLLSRRLTQHPFRRVKGIAQRVAFHPIKPIFFLATKKTVRVYNLRRQMLVKKLVSSARHISSLAIHPSGDHVVIGTIDCRLCWFDLDLSNTPYKTLRYHKKALRQTSFHPRFPLMASCSDDGTVHVFHSKVYSDLIQSPLIVPVKVLRGHEIVKKLGVLDMAFHTTQPWLFTAGADSTIRLYQNIH